MPGRTINRRALLGAMVAATVTMALAAPATANERPGGSWPRPIALATYNVSFGANLSPLFGLTDPDALKQQAAKTFADMVASDYTARADAVARLIARARPDVAGLQEVAKWERFDFTQPQLGFQNLAAFDYQALLLAALERRGVPYDVAVENETFVGALPVDATTAIRFTDENLILVRRGAKALGLTVGETHQAKFAAGFDLATLGIRVTRGYTWADITWSGRTFRFVTTHLEAYTNRGDDPEKSYYRNLQAAELLEQAALSPHPVVITGDINSRPTCTGINTAAYDLIAAAGFWEVWPATRWWDRCGGFTSGQRTLSQPTSTLDHRIDDIFFQPTSFVALFANVIGDRLVDKTASGLWPSDHAGSTAVLWPRVHHHG